MSHEIFANLFRHARRSPDKTALVHNGLVCSYAYLVRYVAAAREHLAGQKLPAPGAIAVIHVRHLLDAWAALLALRGLGLATIQTRGAETVAALGLRDIGCVVMASAEGLPAPDGIAPERVLRLPADLRLAATHGTIPELPAIETHPGGHILTTSGTTGDYKMVPRDAVAEARLVPLLAEINLIAERSVVYVCNFGLWSGGGYRWPLFTWSMGGTVVINQTDDPVWPFLRGDINLAMMTPAAVAALIAAAGDRPIRNDAMRLMVGGGAMTQATLVAAQRRLTPQIYNNFGSTEALTIAITPIERPDDLHWHHVHPARNVEIVDEAGKPLGPGEEGLLRIRMIDVPGGYLDDPAASREVFRDGWFYSGDLAVLDAAGRLALRGRSSDVVNLLGAKFAAAPVEQAVQDRLGVEGVAILTVPQPGGGDSLYAAIETARPLDADAVRAALVAVRPAFAAVPVRVVFSAKLPRNQMGKIERLELRRRILATAGKSDARP